MPKFKVEMTRTTTAVGFWEIEASSSAEAERIAKERLEGGVDEPEEVDVTFGGWEVIENGSEESDESEFPWDLQAGDEVTWNDPDEGACTDTFKIASIEFHGEVGDGDCIIRLTKEDGSLVECFARELS